MSLPATSNQLGYCSLEDDGSPMAADKPVATCQFRGNLDDVLEFLKRTRNELTTLRKVRVWPHILCRYSTSTAITLK